VGYAPTSIKIDGAKHEFDSVRGVLEDVTNLILNLKNIRFKIRDDKKRVEVSYSFSGIREIKGTDLNNDEVEVSTPEMYFATLNEDAVLNFTLVIEKGMGYVPSEDIRPDVEEGFIPLDAFFMPIRKANYEIQNILVEDNPNYEKVVFNIMTDGQTSPIELFKDAISNLYKQISIFNKHFSLGLNSSTSAEDEDGEIKKLLISVDDLNLSARSHNCLTRSDIKYFGELVLMNDKDLSELKNLGKKSLDEIKLKIEEMGYAPGTEIAENIKALFREKLVQLKG
jgi:DNA-directed RNA polymerase subunit alpha